jgi:hypothetical protein
MMKGVIKYITNKNAEKTLRVFLKLVAVHSLLVGICLIFIPADLIKQLGFNECTERFFLTQGGVFHIIMSAAYLMGSSKSKKYECMISFSIIVKLFATIFLLVYFLFVKQSLIILLSFITDGLMGAIIWILYANSKILSTEKAI